MKDGKSLKLAAKSIVEAVQLKRFARRQELYIAIAIFRYRCRFALGKVSQNDTGLAEIAIRVVCCSQIEE